MTLGNIVPVKKWGIIAAFCFTILCVIAICSICRVRSSFSPFWVKDLGVCQEIGLDNKPIGFSDTFPLDSKRIYAFFTLDTKIPVRLKVRWYYESQLISEQQDLFQPGLNYSWITSQSGFKKGTYKVKVGGQTFQFKIEETDSNDITFVTTLNVMTSTKSIVI